MEIIQIREPIFDYGEEKYHVRSYRYNDLIGFQDEISKQTENGMTKCFLYSLWTQPAIDNTIIYWVRCKFI